MPSQRVLLVAATIGLALFITGCRQTGIRGGTMAPASGGSGHTPYETPIPSGGSPLPPSPAANMPREAPRLSPVVSDPPPIPPALGGGFTLPKLPADADSETETASEEVVAQDTTDGVPTTETSNNDEEPALETGVRPDEPRLPPLPNATTVEEEPVPDSEELGELPPSPGSELEMPGEDSDTLDDSALTEPAPAVTFPQTETTSGTAPVIAPQRPAPALKNGVESWPVGGLSSEVIITPGPASVPAAMQKPRRLPEEPQQFKTQPLTLRAFPGRE